MIFPQEEINGRGLNPFSGYRLEPNGNSSVW